MTHETEPHLEMALTPCLVLNGVMYVPHYTIPGMYAKPGGGCYLESQLVRAGAKPTKEFLWKRRHLQ